MPIGVNIHRSQRHLTGERDRIEVEGGTVGECLRNLTAMFPELEGELFDGTQKLRNTIEIYLNYESAYPDELKKTTKDGDEIHVTVMLAGG